MPGHSSSAVAAHPQVTWSGRHRESEKWSQTGVFCLANDEAVAFPKDVLDEMIGLFDSEFVHIGGDECLTFECRRCPNSQARTASFGGRLQNWFTREIAAFLVAKGRRPVTWNEVIGSDLPSQLVVMAWRGGGSDGPDAARMGHATVMSPQLPMYFDNNKFDEPDGHEYNGGSNPLVDVYAFDPTADYPDDLKRFVKGVQANVRAEFIFDAEDLEWKVFTRAAVAEVAWTINKDWPRFLTGLSRVEIGRLKMRPAQ
jgi:hexosaminidase